MLLLGRIATSKNNLPNSRLVYKTHTLVETTMAKLDTYLLTKAAKNYIRKTYSPYKGVSRGVTVSKVRFQSRTLHLPNIIKTSNSIAPNLIAN